MKRLTIGLCTLLIVGHVLTESAEILERVNNYQPVFINPFLSPSYEFYDPKGISLYWWVKYCCDDFLWCVTFFVLAKIAYQYSFRLFLVGCVFFGYHLVDGFMLWWDYKTSHWMYWVLNIVVVACVVIMFVPEKKRAIVKSLK